MKLWAILPELVLAGLCLGLVPIAGWVRGRWRRLPAAVAGAGMVACIGLTARMLPWEPVRAFDGAYAVDGFGHVFKLVLLTASLASLVLLAAFLRGRRGEPHGPVALLFVTLGSTLLVSAQDLAVIALALQMLSMGVYVLAALERSRDRALEAALKYFIYAAVAMAVMIYGLTFLYGMTGSLDLAVIGDALAAGGDGLWIALVLALVLAGYGFEIAMVPFHPWSPDVFDGACAPVAGFISVVPKVAALAALLRLLLLALPGGLVGWPMVLAGLAAATMTLGNLAALRQRTLKRLLAYSSIAQAGYLLAGVAVADRVPGALAAVAYYTAAYLFMNLGAFAVVAQLERAAGSDRFEDVRGLARRHGGLATVLALALLSLAGIPPLAGFAAKVLVLEVVIGGGVGWLAVLAAANMVVGLAYYVRVIAETVLEAPEGAPEIRGGVGFVAVHVLNLAGTVVLGVLPGPVLEMMRGVGTILGR